MDADRAQRRRMAADLHDHTMQYLATLLLKIDLIELDFGALVPSPRLDELRELVDVTADKLRRLQGELDPDPGLNRGLTGARGEAHRQVSDGSRSSSPRSTASLRVLIVDDHQLMREGLRLLIERENDIVVVGEAGNAEDALRLGRELSPQIVLMDINMPGVNGIETTRDLLHEQPNLKVLGLSMHSNDQLMVEMMRAGAAGYVSKLSAGREVVMAIRTVATGKPYLTAEATGVLLGDLSGQDKGVNKAKVELTRRERQVLRLLAEGESSKEIAHDLGISPRTVDVHRKNLMDKLDLHSVAALTRYALRQGLISDDD